jgi:hypothetical protein
VTSPPVPLLERFGLRSGHGFSFPWLRSMTRKRPDRYGAEVNGLHGCLAPRIDNRQKETEKKKIAAQCSGLNFRADEFSGRAVDLAGARSGQVLHAPMRAKVGCFGR